MKAGDVIEKPWGREEILDLTASYCVKRLTVRAGRRLSLQYHERKRETMVLVAGAALISLGDAARQETAPMRKGEAYVIAPGAVHRVEGLPSDDSPEGAVIIEASTPDLDDVVRIGDDYGRD